MPSKIQYEEMADLIDDMPEATAEALVERAITYSRITPAFVQAYSSGDTSHKAFQRVLRGAAYTGKIDRLFLEGL